MDEFAIHGRDSVMCSADRCSHVESTFMCFSTIIRNGSKRPWKIYRSEFFSGENLRFYAQR